MSKKGQRHRIPYQVAALRLKERLDASPAEIALWVAGFVTGTKLVAFTSELDDAAPFDFQSGIYPNDPDWLDYGKKLSGCYFEELAVETLQPTERFIGVPEAIQTLQRVMENLPDAAGLIRSRIKNGDLTCLHPIAGFPELDDDVQFAGALLPNSDLERTINTYRSTGFGDLPRSIPTRKEARLRYTDTGKRRVAWRRVLYAHISEIDEQHNGKASVRQVIRWLRLHGGDQICDEEEADVEGADVLVWFDDNRTRQRARKATVANAISEARGLPKDHD